MSVRRSLRRVPWTLRSSSSIRIARSVGKWSTICRSVVVCGLAGLWSLSGSACSNKERQLSPGEIQAYKHELRREHGDVLTDAQWREFWLSPARTEAGLESDLSRYLEMNEREEAQERAAFQGTGGATGGTTTPGGNDGGGEG